MSSYHLGDGSVGYEVTFYEFNGDIRCGDCFAKWYLQHLSANFVKSNHSNMDKESNLEIYNT